MHLWFILTATTILTFLILLLLVRWLGATQLTQLTFFNWVAGASMGNLAANMIASTTFKEFAYDSYTLILFTAACLFAAYVALKSRPFRRIANGEPIVLVHNGRILRHNLAKTKVNLDVLMMLLREKGYFAYNEIQYAILEPTGNLSILPSQGSQSASKEDLAYGPNLSDKGQGPYVEIVVDAEIDADKLAETGHSGAWLNRQIRKHGGKSLEDVMFLAVNKDGHVLADLSRRDKSDESDTLAKPSSKSDAKPKLASDSRSKSDREVQSGLGEKADRDPKSKSGPKSQSGPKSKSDPKS